MSTPDLNVTPAQTAFNDLRLPVLWIKDEKNPGTLDKDEIYVHPSFVAVNAVLKAEGKPPIPVEQIIAAGLKFINTPEEQRVRHPLLTKDLATRAEPFMDFDIRSIGDRAVAAATRLSVEIAALGDVYHRTQVEPKYVEQLRAVVESGDAQRIHHYFLRGWIGCIDKDTAANPLDCNPVPGGTRSTNGVWYPPDWTKEDIAHLQKEYVWKSPALKRAVFSPHSRVVEVTGERATQLLPADVFAYKGRTWHVLPLRSVERLRWIGNMMGTREELAAAVLQSSAAPFAAMLRSQSTYLRSDNLFGDLATDTEWVNVNHPSLTTVFARTETYGMFGSPFEDKATM